MGTVPIRKQWLIVAAAAALFPVFALFAASLAGWLLLRRLWVRPRTGSIKRAAAAPGEE